ncbi:MAG: hypothetical protein ACI8WY_003479, partial [Planctomycetota bacterium]
SLLGETPRRISSQDVAEDRRKVAHMQLFTSI